MAVRGAAHARAKHRADLRQALTLWQPGRVYHPEYFRDSLKPPGPVAMMTMHPRTMRHLTMEGRAVRTRLASSSPVLAAILLLISVGCAGSRISQSISQPYNGPRVRSIALSPGGGVLGDAVGVELFNRGFSVVDPGEAGRLIGRSDLSELEISSGASLEALQGKGIDALLVVKMAAGEDGLPQSASVRLTNTRTQQVIAAISWQNGWGGQRGSMADRTMRKDVAAAAQEIVNGLLKTLR